MLNPVRFCLLISVLIGALALPSLAAAAPVNDVPPSLSTDHAQVDDSIEVDPGEWTGADGFNYQWLRCDTADQAFCTEIGGANDQYYTVQPEDELKHLGVRVIAYDDLGSTVLEVGYTDPVAYRTGIITNGIVRMGVLDKGELNVDYGPQSNNYNWMVGLRLKDGEYEATSGGSPAEGWGVADATRGVVGYANRSEGYENVETTSYVTSASEASSTVIVKDDDEPFLQIEQHFKPSVESQYLYENEVTITPLQLTGIGDLRYRRTIDWDIQPTEFDEVVTNIFGNSPYLRYMDDNGFSNPSPLGGRSPVITSGEAYNLGPDDIGAMFDFDFDALPYGQTRTFKIYYGAAPTRTLLYEALEAVHAETFSIGQNSTPEGYNTGGPAIFAMAYSDVGGDEVFGDVSSEITDGPADYSIDGNVSFSFQSANEEPTFECAMDDSAWTACVSPISYNGLEKGHHSFRVRATSGGVTQLLPTIRAFEVNSHPYQLYWYTAPDWWGSDTNATFGVDSDNMNIGDLDLSCSLDGADFEPCAEYNTFVDLEPGEHSFRVNAEGYAGVEQLEYSWTISDAIMSRFGGTPSAYDGDRTPEFWWERGGPVEGVECSLDGGDWYDCSEHNSTELNPLPDGEHTFRIRAFDSAHEYQDGVTSYTWVLDSTNPVLTTTIPSTVTALPFTGAVTSDEEMSKLRCELDDSRVDCDAIVLDDLEEGWHELYAWGEDRAGNYNSFNYEFVIQIGAPVASITTRPKRYFTAPQDITIPFASMDDGVTFECRVDGDDWHACVSPAKVSRFQQGDHSDHLFEVRAVKGDVTQQYADWASWRIDDDPFDIEFDRAPDEWTSNRGANFEFYADDYNGPGVSFTCSLDGGASVACFGAANYTNLAVGHHIFKVTASADDVSGTETETYEWTISDTVGTTLRDRPNRYSSSANAYFEWSVHGDSNGVECRLDGADWEECSSGHTVSDLAEGDHTFELRARDSSDVLQDPITSYTWTVDTTNPTLTLGSYPPTITDSPYTVPLTSSESNVKILCSVDGGPRMDCGFPVVLSGLDNGEHTFSAYAEDSAGNSSDDVGATFNLQPGSPIDPGTPPVAPKPVKPTVSKLAKPKKGKFTVPWTCADATCTVSAKIKAGKKTLKLKSKKVKKGKGKLTFKLSKSQQKTLKKTKKKKSTLTVTITGPSGKATKTLKF